MVNEILSTLYNILVTEKYFLNSISFQENSLFILTFYKLKNSSTSSLYDNVAIVSPHSYPFEGLAGHCNPVRGRH